MAGVAIVADRDCLADALVRGLRGSPMVDWCERARLHLGDGAALLRSADTVVCAVGSDPDVAAISRIQELSATAGFRHLVVIGSAAIYGADHRNTGRLSETAFVSGHRNGVVRGWIAVEEAAQRLATTGRLLTVLRPAIVLDGSGYFSGLLGGRTAVTYPGHDPTIQCLSSVDLAGATRAVVERRVAGVFNVAPAAPIPLKKALRAAGVFRLPVPRVPQTVLRSIMPGGRVWRPDQLDYIRFSWTVSADKLKREVAFVPTKSSAEAIAEFRGRAQPSPGDCSHDEFGMDPEYIARYCGHLFRFLHDVYWRVEIRGVEHLPRTGRGVLVGMHRGFMPFDGVMLLYAAFRRAGRIPRFLIHPSLTKFPFLGDFMAKLGGIMACVENADWVLERDEVLGVFPEGIQGAFTMYKRAYSLGRFGRDDYVRMALRNRAPILPVVTVGSAEIYPILKRVDWPWFKRYTEWPFLPVVPAPFPLPSKWHTLFLPPIHVEAEHPPAAAENPAIVASIGRTVRGQMQDAVTQMLSRRRSIFRGSVFDGQEA